MHPLTHKMDRHHGSLQEQTDKIMQLSRLATAAETDGRPHLVTSGDVSVHRHHIGTATALTSFIRGHFHLVFVLPKGYQLHHGKKALAGTP